MWSEIEKVQWISTFEGIDSLGLDIEELMAILFNILDEDQRMIVLTALQDKDFDIAPLYPFPEERNKHGGRFHKRVYSKQDRSKFWLHTP